MDLNRLIVEWNRFAKAHLAEITATIGLVSYALARRKLTPGGILAGIAVAGIHMMHPWPAFFWLLIFFFLFGTFVTRIGHAAKAQLTQSPTGGAGGEGARTAAQVVANSGTACALIVAHTYLLAQQPFVSLRAGVFPGLHVSPALQNLLPVGIVAQYAAVAADTFSSELGILARAPPVLVTAPWRTVPRGTNGGVTLAGLAAAAAGSLLLVALATLFLNVFPPRFVMDMRVMALLVAAGVAGSLIDSVLGALVQTTVTDRRSGRVIEGPGGTRVHVAAATGRVQVGRDWLTNNGVNLVMAASTSVLAMAVAWVWGLELDPRWIRY